MIYSYMYLYYTENIIILLYLVDHSDEPIFVSTPTLAYPFTFHDLILYFEFIHIFASVF